MTNFISYYLFKKTVNPILYSKCVTIYIDNVRSGELVNNLYMIYLMVFSDSLKAVLTCHVVICMLIPVLNFFFFLFLSMDGRREVDDIVREAESVAAPEFGVISNEALRLAALEVSKLLAMTDDSLEEICNNIEGATSRESCREGFRRFNEVIRMFLVSAPDPDDDNQVRSAIISLGPCARLRSLLERQSSGEEAITAYKTLILKYLTASLSQSAATRAVSEAG